MVDHLSNVYMVNGLNHRIMCQSKRSKEGRIIVAGNRCEAQPNQFWGLTSLLFDRNGNFYVMDWKNHRIQKFEIDSS